MKTKHNQGVDLGALISRLDGLDRAVLQVLRASIGRDRAMPRSQLVDQIRRNPAFRSVNERHVRLAIQEMRNSGKALICSTGGIGGGYWLADSWEEVEEFIDKELEPRALGLLETKKAMLYAAGRQFGPKPATRQGVLF